MSHKHSFPDSKPSLVNNNASVWSLEKMLDIVEGSFKRLTKLSNGQRNPLLSHREIILHYFKLNKIDGDSFDHITEQNFKYDLIKCIGISDKNQKIGTALGLLFKYIQFYRNIPLKKPQPHKQRYNMHRTAVSTVICKPITLLPKSPQKLKRVISDSIKSCKKQPKQKHKVPPTLITKTNEEEKLAFDKRSLHIDVATDNIHHKKNKKRVKARATKHKSLRHRQGQTWRDPLKLIESNRIYSYDDVVFKWEKTSTMVWCNHQHFLYIVSVVIDEINDEIQQSNDDAQLLINKTLILSYLHYCKVDGMLFNRSQQQFVQNIQHIVFNTRNQSHFLTERFKYKYTNELYQRIIEFDLNYIVASSICHISFCPSSCNDSWLRKGSFSIISTLNQYEHCSYLHRESEKQRIIETLNECQHKIASVLCDKWVVHINDKAKTWHHNIQNIKQCSLLNMLYLLHCILLNKQSKNRLILADYASKIMECFEKYQWNGAIFKSMLKKEFVQQLYDYIDPEHAIKDIYHQLLTLYQEILKINVYKITSFYIKTDLKWNTKTMTIKQCKAQDMIYILIHLLSDPSLVALVAFQDKIVEYFVKNKINGSMFDKIKAQVFVDDLDKCMKFNHKAPLVKLYYAIKRCQLQDIANVSTENESKTRGNPNKGSFMKWNKRTNFKSIKRVGYKWDDGVIVIADIISYSYEKNKNKIQLHYSYLGEPFWLTLPNHKLSKPTKEVIQESHFQLYNKWMMILRIKNKQCSRFDGNIFRQMACIAQIHPQLISTLKHSNYTVQLEDKTYKHLLQSVFASSLGAKCRNSRCDGKPKLNCYCDVNTFQKYAYYMIMAIMTQYRIQKQNNKKQNHIELFLLRWMDTNTATMISILIVEYTQDIDSMLQILKSQSDNTYTLSEQICAFLPPQLQVKDTSFERYKKHIRHWLLHDFYNIICSHCGGINKSIMINRVFHYSSTLRL